MSDDLAVDDEDDQAKELRLTGREVLARIAPYALRFKAELLQASALLVVVVAIGLAAPLVLGEIVDVARQGPALAGGGPRVLRLAGLFVLLVGVGFLLEATLGFLMARVGVACTLQLKEDLFKKVLGLDPAFFRDHPPGRLIARVESDTESIKNLFTNTALQVVRALLTFVGITALMCAYDPAVTLVMLPVLVLLAPATVFFVRVIRGYHKASRRHYAAVTGHLTEYLQGMSVVQHHGYGKKAEAELHRLNVLRFEADSTGSMLNQGFWGFFAFCEVATSAAVIVVAARQVVEGRLTLGTLIVFLEYVRQAFLPVQMLSEFVSQVQQGIISAGRVFGILGLQPAAPDAPGARTDVELKDAVRFEGVDFHYDPQRPVLRGVSFEVPRGKHVALVGPSGGGKSTIVSLLLRFHEPVAGRVTIDGQDLRGVARAAWRRRVGLVLQEVYLFPGTLGENLSVFDEARPAADVERACQVVHADGLVRRLPEGLATTLAERGANLSLGERQLVSLARALVHDPLLLVLDEATSSIDPRTEGLLQDSLQRLMAGRTALIVAHRLATVRRCDEILVVEGGRIVERGTHDALWARRGAYWRLARLQFPELKDEPSPPTGVATPVATPELAKGGAA